MKETPTNKAEQTPPLTVKTTERTRGRPRERAKEAGTWAYLVRVRCAAAKAG